MTKINFCHLLNSKTQDHQISSHNYHYDEDYGTIDINDILVKEIIESKTETVHNIKSLWEDIFRQSTK